MSVAIVTFNRGIQATQREPAWLQTRPYIYVTLNEGVEDFRMIHAHGGEKFPRVWVGFSLEVQQQLIMLHAVDTSLLKKREKKNDSSQIQLLIIILTIGRMLR